MYMLLARGLTLYAVYGTISNLTQSVFGQLGSKFVSNKVYAAARERALYAIEQLRKDEKEHYLARFNLQQDMIHDMGAYQLMLMLSECVEKVSYNARWGQRGETITYANTDALQLNTMVGTLAGDTFITIYRTTDYVEVVVSDFEHMRCSTYRRMR